MYRPGHYEDIKNITTGLMALRDIATLEHVPINAHVADGWIHVIVGFGTPWTKKQSFYLQDLYRYENKIDQIYTWIEEAIAEIRAMRDRNKADAKT